MKELFTKLRALRYGVRLGKEVRYMEIGNFHERFPAVRKVEGLSKSKYGQLLVKLEGRERAIPLERVVR